MIFGVVGVSVDVGGNQIDEYGTITDWESGKASCWIASEKDKEFTVKLINNSAHDTMSFSVHIDGRRAYKTVVRPGRTEEAMGVVASPETVLPFMFSLVQVSDDDSLRNKVFQFPLDALGTISVTAQRVVINQVTEYQWHNRPIPPAIGLLHERTKKDGGHYISLGKERRNASYSAWRGVDVTCLDPPGSPYCSFRYCYRSRDILKAQGIIPVSPKALAARPLLAAHGTGQESRASGFSKRRRDSSVSEEEPDFEHELLDAGMTVARARLESLEAKRSAAKARAQRKRVKREPSPAELSFNGEVIDLTSD